MNKSLGESSSSSSDEEDYQDMNRKSNKFRLSKDTSWVDEEIRSSLKSSNSKGGMNLAMWLNSIART